jgi:hypothetical protein
VQELNCEQMRALTAVAFFGRRNEVKVAAKAGVRVQQPLQICLEGSSKTKKCDNLSRFFNKKAGNNLPLLSVL